MNLSIPTENETRKVQATLIADEARLDALPRHFGRYFTVTENAIYGFMREFAADYRGAYYQFFDLSNGGFYAAPDLPPLELSINSNGFGGRMSADAAGITVCLFAYSHLSFRYQQAEVFGRQFHALRDYAADHAEAGKIFAAID
jgi:hypothetical protein